MATIVWLKSKEEAFALAKAQGKKVLLLVGSKLCDSTLFMRDTVCELPTLEWPDSPDIKGLIERHFIPWYGGASYSVPGAVGDPVTTDWYSYAKQGSFSMPLIAVIDPDTDKCLGENSYGSVPRMVENTSQFDSQKFYDRLAQYTAEPPVVCAYTISPVSAIFKPAPTHTAMGDVGSKGTVAVTALPISLHCAWTAVSNDPWIKIAAGSEAGTGNGTVAYSVLENTGSIRTGTLTIGGKTFTVTQNGVVSEVVPPVTPPVILPVIKAALYFPHAAVIDGWQTEICIINTENKPSSGSLKLYNEQGVLTGEKPLTLPAFGRKQILVNTEFTGSVVDYAVFATESASVEGYTRFWRQGEYGAALGAIHEGKEFGVFAKIEKEGGWTGIAFINTGAAPASVTLTAYTDAGIIVGTKVLAVAANAKVVNTIEKLLTGDIGQATYVTYLSDRKVAGFELLGSADNRMLDGFNAL